MSFLQFIVFGRSSVQAQSDRIRKVNFSSPRNTKTGFFQSQLKVVYEDGHEQAKVILEIQVTPDGKLSFNRTYLSKTLI